MKTFTIRHFQLGGVALPNDGKCHMTDGLYTFSSKMDYPSLSFLRDRMVEAEIVPIFATTGNLDLYKVSNAVVNAISRINV